MKIHVVGCGFLGSLFTQEVLKLGFGLHENLSFKFFDPDKVEERNVANQLWNPHNIGEDKVGMLGMLASDYNHAVSVWPDRLTKETLPELADADVVVCSVDNIETRQLLWKYAISKAVPLLNLGVSQQGTGAVDWTFFERGIDTNPFGLTQGQSEEELKQYGKLDKLPPCELVAFRGLGLNIGLAAAKALFILYGWDTEGTFHPIGQKGPWGTFTTWTATSKGHALLETFKP